MLYFINQGSEKNTIQCMSLESLFERQNYRDPVLPQCSVPEYTYTCTLPNAPTEKARYNMYTCACIYSTSFHPLSNCLICEINSLLFLPKEFTLTQARANLSRANALYPIAYFFHWRLDTFDIHLYYVKCDSIHHVNQDGRSAKTKQSY